MPFSTHDPETLFRDYVAAVKNAVRDLHATVDQLFADKRGRSIFTRLIIRGTLREAFMGVQPVGRPFEYSELAFYEFRDSQIVHIRATQVREQIQNQSESVPRTPFDTGFGYEAPENKKDLETWFMTLLNGIAKGKVEETLLNKVAPEIIFNGTQRVPVEKMIERNLAVQAASHGLHIEFDALVIDEEYQRVGCGYNVIGRAVKDFKFLKAGQIGITCRFVIHYRNEEGKQAAMWSIVDADRALDPEA